MSGENFFQVTALGHIGLDAVDNVFYYKYTPLVPAAPTEADIELVASRFDNYMAPLVAACQVADYLMDGVLVRAYDSTGHPSTLIPYTLPVSHAGHFDSARDGNVHSLILRARMTDLHVLEAGAAGLRSAYWSVGPLASAFVANDGSFTEAGSSSFTDLKNAVGQGLADIAGIFFAFPIKVSHTVSHEPVAQITSWRDVIGASFRPQTGFRKSRTNGR